MRSRILFHGFILCLCTKIFFPSSCRVFRVSQVIEIVFVCPYPEKRNYLTFVNISPTVVIDTSMARGFPVLQHGNQKSDFTRNKMLNRVFLLSCFVNNFQLMLCTLIVLLSYAIHKNSCRSQHTSVLTTCTFMFRQVCTIEPSFFKTTSGMHRRPFEGRHLV